MYPSSDAGCRYHYCNLLVKPDIFDFEENFTFLNFVHVKMILFLTDYAKECDLFTSACCVSFGLKLIFADIQMSQKEMLLDSKIEKKLVFKSLNSWKTCDK